MECTARDQRFRRGFTAVEKTELWSCWERGGSLKAVGRAFSKPPSSICYQVAALGGDLTQVLRRPVEPATQSGHWMTLRVFALLFAVPNSPGIIMSV